MSAARMFARLVVLPLSGCGLNTFGMTNGTSASATVAITDNLTDADSAGQATASATASSSAGTTIATHGETNAGETNVGEATTVVATTGVATTSEITTGGDAPSCEEYCASITANCSGGQAQYGSPQTCLATCEAFSPGTIADKSGNTLGCRAYHATAAVGDPLTHCTHAGPGGGAVCGADCDGFCTISAYVCPDAWPDEPACQVACGTFSSDELYDASDVSGDTFACRLYHLTAAAFDPATHCAHIKSDSAPCM